MPIKTKKKKRANINPQKYVYQKKKYKGQNRPSEIRLSGVPPVMPIKTNKKKQTKTIRQNRPSEIPLSGVPPIMHKNQKK